MSELRFENLSIGYKVSHGVEKVVASGLTAAVVRGELTCLIGRNGVGKSTLLRTLTGFLKPLAGRIYGLEGRLERQVSIVLSVQPADVNLSVEEVVGMGRMPYTNFWGTLRAEDRAVVREAVRQVGIERLARANFMRLSDGERQKVMIAKALAQQTPFIVLDEPTAFLDYPSKREVMALLQRLASEQGKAVLLSTHDMELVEEFAGQVWFMDGGQLHTFAARDMDVRGLFSV